MTALFFVTKDSHYNQSRRTRKKPPFLDSLNKNNKDLRGYKGVNQENGEKNTPQSSMALRGH